ncbi:hypothetical protein WA026_000959 [Henosepilachna vigintioctopunctata]|uniref:Uncharacterized protein n=1 Tax=Henosepilachna vigintioctopunctata TaxID=420089 RepID=A0AAW1V5V0_9CUCU
MEESQRKVSAQDIDLDDVLPKIGEFGKYQKLMLWLVCLPACFPCGFCAFNQLFMINSPPHWCWVPELGNLTVNQRKNLAIPKENDTKFSKCFQYDFNWSDSYEINENKINFNDRADVTNHTVACRNGWEFDMSNIESTIVKDVSVD